VPIAFRNTAVHPQGLPFSPLGNNPSSLLVIGLVSQNLPLGSSGGLASLATAATETAADQPIRSCPTAAGIAGTLLEAAAGYVACTSGVELDGRRTNKTEAEQLRAAAQRCMAAYIPGIPGQAFTPAALLGLVTAAALLRLKPEADVASKIFGQVPLCLGSPSLSTGEKCLLIWSVQELQQVRSF